MVSAVALDSLDTFKTVPADGINRRHDASEFIVSSSDVINTVSLNRNKPSEFKSNASIVWSC